MHYHVSVRQPERGADCNVLATTLSSGGAEVQSEEVHARENMHAALSEGDHEW